MWSKEVGLSGGCGEGIEKICTLLKVLDHDGSISHSYRILQSITCKTMKV